MKGPKPLRLSREIREQMRHNVESLVAETLALLRPDVPPRVPPKSKRIAPKPRKRRGTTARR
jgi:hypothetical protein